MKLSIDQNKLLVIENQNTQQTKKYSYNVSGYKFSSFDKKIIVYHKKQFKIINLKDLGDKMGVIMIGAGNKELDIKKLDIPSMNNALRIFEGFNEETGEKYSFLYKFTENKLEDLNNKLRLLGSTLNFKKTSKGFCCPINNENSENDAISFLFGLTLAYGNINIKNGDIKSIKTQVPLFGIFREKTELLDTIIDHILNNNMFLKTNIQEANDGIIYQITSSDFELLKIFARFYEPIEKGLKIGKYDEMLEIKKRLIEFLNTNIEIPTEGKPEVLNEIEDGIIKVLVK